MVKLEDPKSCPRETILQTEIFTERSARQNFYYRRSENTLVTVMDTRDGFFLIRVIISNWKNNNEMLNLYSYLLFRPSTMATKNLVIRSR